MDKSTSSETINNRPVNAENSKADRTTEPVDKSTSSETNNNRPFNIENSKASEDNNYDADIEIDIDNEDNNNNTVKTDNSK